MNSKPLLMAIAALALSVTGAQAFNSEMLARANLTEEERTAFAMARELQGKGEVVAAKEVLIEAGIDEFALERLRLSMALYRSSNDEVYRLPGDTMENGDDESSFNSDTSTSQ